MEKPVRLFEAIFRNHSHGNILLHLEPWGDQIELKPGTNRLVRMWSDKEGVPEICHEAEAIILYGWEGCRLSLDDDNPVPPVP